MSAPVQLVTNALIDGLRLAGFRIGDHELPTDRAFPYTLLFIVSDAPPAEGPPLTNPEIDTWVGVQLTSVGSGRKMAQWQSDKIREFMTGRTAAGTFSSSLPAIPGWRVADRLGSTPGGVAPEGTAPNTLYNAPDRFVLYVTPA